MTQHFGAQTPAPPAPGDPLGGSAAAPAARPHTQMFGISPLLSTPKAAPPRAGTQVFGGSVAPSIPPLEAPPSRSSTQLFAPTNREEKPTPATITSQESSALERLWDEPSVQSTQASSDPYADDLPLDEDATAAPYRSPPIALPPEVQALIPEAEGEDAPELMLESQIRRRNRIALGTVAALVLGVGAFLGYRLLIAHRTAVSAELLGQGEAAFALLRRDDHASQVKAVESLRALAKAHPQFVEARADTVVALALELDDARIAIRRAEMDSEVLNRQVSRLREEHTPGDWENRVNAMIERLQAIKKETDPRVDEAAALDKDVNEAYRTLAVPGTDLTAREEQSVIRAQAVYFGVKGSDQALTLTERYKALHTQDGWETLALAEYALNARVSPETSQEAGKALDGMVKADSAFLRPYVLSARLAAREKRYDAAIGSLEAVVALNPSHEVARKLLSWALDEQRNSVAPTPPP